MKQAKEVMGHNAIENYQGYEICWDIGASTPPTFGKARQQSFRRLTHHPVSLQ